MLEDIPIQTSKFRTKYPIEINDDSHSTYNIDSQIRFKTAMLKSILSHYNDVYIVVKETKNYHTGAAAAPNNRNREVVFKNCAPFNNSISEINNTQIDNAIGIDLVTLMYNLIEYIVNHSETSGILWKYYRDQADSNNGGNIITFPNDDTSLWFNYKKCST